MKSLSVLKRGSSESRFLGSVVVLVSWTAVAQLVSVVTMLVLPRLFLPQQFGVFSIFSGVVVMLGIVAAARYEFAIGLPRDDAEGAALFTLCVGLASAAAAVSLLVFILLPGQNWLFDRFPELRPWWPWVAAGVACIGWYNAVSYLALRGGHFDAVGKSKAAIALATAIGQVLGGLFVTRGDASLIIPFLVGQLLGVVLIVHALLGRPVWNAARDAVLRVAHRYVRFPKYVAPGSLLDGIAVLLPVAAVAGSLSTADAGFYALAERTLRIPVTLIGSSVLQVFYKRMADIRGDQVACRRLVLTTWRNLALMAALPCALLSVFGEPLFGVVFGANWRASGRLAETLVVGVFVLFVSYPTSNILVINERTRTFLAWQMARLLIVAGVLLVALRWYAGSLESIVRLLVGAQVCVYLFSMWLQWRAVVDTSDPGRGAG